jgi:hypothetical protein
MIKRTTKMSVTTIRREKLTTVQSSLTADCSVCGRRVDLISRDEAMKLLGTDGDDFDCLAALGLVHTLKTLTGGAWICKDSLIARGRPAGA